MRIFIGTPSSTVPAAVSTPSQSDEQIPDESNIRDMRPSFAVEFRCMATLSKQLETANSLLEEKEVALQKYESDLKSALDFNFGQLSDVLLDFCPNLEPALQHYAQDRIFGSDTLLGFRRAPAGKGVHHAYEGGLVEHYLEMLTIADHLRLLPPFDSLEPADILFGVFAHDVHKGYAHFKYEGGRLVYSNNHTTRHLTNNQKTIHMLSPYVEFSILELNMIFGSEGGYALDRPKEDAVISKFVYLLDELSVARNRLIVGKPISIYPVGPEFFPQPQT